MYKKILPFIYRYYLDIFLFYIFMCTFLIKKIPHFFFQNRINYHDAYIILIANTSLLIATYALNKISDSKEDRINNTHSLEMNRENIAIIALLYIVSFLLYLFQKNTIFLLYWLILFALSFFYSFPKKYRLKKIFLIKNIIPSFSWYFSLCIMFFSCFNNLYMSKIMYLLLPLLLLFFIFEILWDLPDTQGDKQENINTFPVFFGFNTTKKIILILIIIAFLFENTIFNKIICLILFIFTLHISKNTKKEIFHMFILLITLFLGILLLTISNTSTS